MADQTTVALPSPKCVHPDPSGEIIYTAMQILSLFVAAKIISWVIKPLGQPRIVAQFLAGFVMGKFGFYYYEEMMKVVSTTEKIPKAIEYITTLARMLVMLLTGLELDVNYSKQARCQTTKLVIATALCSGLLAVVFNVPLYELLYGYDNPWTFMIVMIMIFSNIASPIVVRLAAELRLASMEVGRMAISTALLNDVSTFIFMSFFPLLARLFALHGRSKNHGIGEILRGIGSIIIISIGMRYIKPLARRLNRQHRKSKELKYHQMTTILLYIAAVATACEALSRCGMVACLILGAAMPRDGKAVRTLTAKLAYPVNRLLLPIYFSYIGMQANLDDFRLYHYCGIAAIIVLSTAGKVLGTLIATRDFGMRIFEAVVLGLLLNVKGQVGMMVLDSAKKLELLHPTGYQVILATVVLSTVVITPIVTGVIKIERHARRYSYMGFEQQRPNTEVRMVTCVYGPDQLPGMLNVLEISRATDESPLIAYVFHLIELTDAFTTHLFYHQRQEFEEYECGQSDAVDINNVIDAYTQESGLTIRQLTSVSEFSDMYLDVLQGANDTRAAMIVLPFHRKLAVNGKMIDGKEGERVLNQKVIQHAKCTVGILIDRGLGGTNQMTVLKMSHQIAVLFFGGPDDREAVAFGCRLAEHPCVSLTVIRFLPSSEKDFQAGIEIGAARDEQILSSLTEYDKQTDADVEFISKFYDRYVVSGLVSYVEKFVQNGAETVSAISAMDGMFSLFIVGKSGQVLSPLTMGISDWQEFPELGVIGDLLASSDFTQSGSVLVIKQHAGSKKKKAKDEFRDVDDFAVD